MVKVNVNNLNVRTCLVLLSWKVGHAVRAMSAGSLPSGEGGGRGPLFISTARFVQTSEMQTGLRFLSADAEH